jgi:hypothetical protein
MNKVWFCGDICLTRIPQQRPARKITRFKTPVLRQNLLRVQRKLTILGKTVCYAQNPYAITVISQRQQVGGCIDIYENCGNRAWLQRAIRRRDSQPR